MDEDDILAILNRDEVAFGDAIGDDRDEDFIPGPDDDEGSGEDDDGEADADPSSPDAATARATPYTTPSSRLLKHGTTGTKSYSLWDKLTLVLLDHI